MDLPSLLLEELTAPEIRQAIDAGYSTVIVPSGATEQHGPHIVMASDTLQARAIGLRLAAQLGKTLVAPAIAVGCSDHHMAFAGTISVRSEVFQEIHIDYCRSLARHGFRRIACYSGHGGNFRPLAAVLPRLRDVAAPAKVAAYTDLVRYIGALRDVVVGSGMDIAKVGGHADVAESSIVMSFDTQYVRPDRAEVGYQGRLEDVIPRVRRDGLQSVSPNGILGDPTGFNAALGERCVAALTDLLAAYFQSEAAWSSGPGAASDGQT
jgi:creatinine amidohydrolase